MLRRLCAVTAAFAAAVSAQVPAPPAGTAPPPVHLVQVRTRGPAELQRLLALDLDLAGCRAPLPAQRRIEVVVDDAELALLQAQGFAVQVLQRDLSAHYAAQAARFPAGPGHDLPNPPLGQGAMGGHWTLAQMEAILDALHAANPAICAAKTPIGTTVEGRPIWMVKVSDHVGTDEGEPEVLFDALHHAREPLSMEATVLFLDWLVTNYGTDPEATLLVDERELFFVPCLNPDGYEYNRQTNPGGGGMWRKNRRDNGNGTFGVDLNRNYPTGWSAPNGGSSATTSSDTYRGPAPLSEPETAAIEAFAQGRQFVTVFSTHTYTDVLLRPWGWQNGDPANVADYQTLGGYYTRENGVAHGSTSALLYIASGSAVDHHHTVRGSLSWTAELGRLDEGGFWPSGPAIAAIALRHQPMFRKVARTAGPAFAIAGVAVAEGPGANQNGTVEPGETGQVVVAVQNFGLLPAGASVTLQAISPGVQVLAGAAAIAAVPRLGTADHAAAPLQFAVAVGTTAATVQVRVLVSGDGATTEQVVDVELVPTRLVLADDFELDRGFARAPGGTATLGLWERAAPQATSSGGTTIQPGAQTTPGGSRCWVTDARAGTAAGSYDVDGGFTDLRSPRLDLAHLQSARLQLRLWYAESVGNDAMAIEVSRDDGQSWAPVYTRSTSTSAWITVEADLGAPLTSQMRVRVRAQDLAASLVECLVDDLRLLGRLPDGSVTLLGSGAPGTTVQAALHAAPGSLCIALCSPALAAAPQAFPGLAGSLLLDPAAALVLPWQQADASGRAAVEVALPAAGGFAGLALHWQQVHFGSGGAAFGANAPVLLLQ